MTTHPLPSGGSSFDQQTPISSNRCILRRESIASRVTKSIAHRRNAVFPDVLKRSPADWALWNFIITIPFEYKPDFLAQCSLSILFHRLFSRAHFIFPSRISLQVFYVLPHIIFMCFPLHAFLLRCGCFKLSALEIYFSSFRAFLRREAMKSSHDFQFRIGMSDGSSCKRINYPHYTARFSGCFMSVSFSLLISFFHSFSWRV